MNKIRSLLAVAFCLYLCVMVMQGMFTPLFDPRKQAINSVLRDFSSYAKEHKLIPISTTISSPGGPIRSLGMGFQIRGPLSHDELRKTLFDLGDYLSKLVNSRDSISSYLLKSPFSIMDSDISLFVIDNEGKPMRFPEFSVAEIYEGRFFFKKYDSDYGPPKVWITETYEDALQAVNRQGRNN